MGENNRNEPQTAASEPQATEDFRGSLDIIRVDSFRPSDEVILELQKHNDPPPSYETVVEREDNEN